MPLHLDRHGEPQRPLGGFDLVAIGEAVLFKLDRVQINEHLASNDLVEIAEPGKIRGLVGGENHVSVSAFFGNSRPSPSWDCPSPKNTAGFSVHQRWSPRR